jgi:hypothetical protein
MGGKNNKPKTSEPTSGTGALIPEVQPAVAKRGRPSKLSPTIQETVCKFIAQGNYVSVACAAAGISPDALSDWRKRGASGEEPYAAFVAALEAAEIEAETRMVNIITSSAPEDWRAAAHWLGRARPARWSRSVEDTAPQELASFELHIHLGGQGMNGPDEETHTTISFRESVPQIDLAKVKIPGPKQ